VTCRICNGTGVVTEVLSHVGEPPDYEPVDCPQCNGTGEATVDDLRVGYDWRAEPPVYSRREGVKRTVALTVKVTVYDEGEGWDVAYAVANRMQKALARQAGSLAVYGAEVDVSDWDE
jgi:hypothetical protein